MKISHGFPLYLPANGGAAPFVVRVVVYLTISDMFYAIFLMPLLFAYWTLKTLIGSQKISIFTDITSIYTC